MLALSHSGSYKLLASGCLLMALAGCKPPPLPDFELIEMRFRTEPGRPTPPGSALSDLDVYIDASKSMKGFALPEGSNYTRIAEHVLDQGAMAGYRITPYQFSSEIRPLPQFSVKDVASPDFYNGSDTPLSKLLEQVGKTPNRLSLIVSDMVQSDKINDHQRMIKALQALTSQRFEVRLLAFRSSFRGDYYVESAPGRTIHLKLSEKLRGNGRPFYLFAAAPNRASLEQLQRYVLDRASEEHAFSPTDAPIVVTEINLTPEGGNKPIWNPYTKPRLFSTPAGSNTHFAAFEEVNPPRSGNSPLSLQLKSSVIVPMYSIAKLRVTARKLTYTRKRGFTQPVQMSIRPDGDQTFKDLTKLVFALSRPQADSWDIYHLLLQAGGGNLAHPAWVEEWTTENDLSPNNGNKTYQLQLIVDAMVRNITEDHVFWDTYLAVGRGR
jgi:hypothetical protein